MDDENLVQLRWFLSVVVALLALIAGATTLLRQSKPKAKSSSRLLREDPAAALRKVREPCEDLPAAPAQGPAAQLPEPLEPGGPGFRRFRLAPQDFSIPDDWEPGEAKLWVIESAAAAADLLAGCPMDTIIACSFHRAFAEHGSAQDRAMRHLAEAQPAGMAFATVDLKEAPDVAAWASVKEPEVRLLRPDGVVLERLVPSAVASGALHRSALQHAGELAKEGRRKLEALDQRFPGALKAELAMCLPSDGIEKMKTAAAKVLGEHVEMLQHLCHCISDGTTAKVRHVATLAKVIRSAGDGQSVLPLLDLSRRLAAEKRLGGEAPGAREALEMLLQAILLQLASLEPGPLVLLALQFLANCFHQNSVAEALLPVVAELLMLPVWQKLWGHEESPEKSMQRCRDAGARLLLNSSVALRNARLRASHQPLLRQSIGALKILPDNPHLNWAVGNLLAMGGGPDDAKETLQAQPSKALSLLAAAIFHGQLDGPEGAAFPAAWHPQPGAAPPLPAPSPAPGRARAPVPGRYRRGGG